MKLVLEIAGLHLKETEPFFRKVTRRDPVRCNLFD